MKVLTIIGTRPEAIKMAPVIALLNQHSEIEAQLCVTGQHREILDQALSLFDLTPDIDLDLMKPNQTLSSMTARVFKMLDPILKKIKPDWILVQGDTTTVFAASMVAYYHNIKIGHVEAGLRTNDKRNPFPEEINRKITSVIADLHFAPTEWAKNNLIKENIPAASIHVTGNTVIDALLSVARIRYNINEGELATIPFENKRIVLVTAHRRENHGAPLENICNSLKSLAKKHEDTVHFVYPVHPNPNVKTVVHKRLENQKNISLLPPLDYLPLVYLMKNSYFVITDSGGIQEEAPSFGKPVLILRKATERPEGIQAGIAKLIGTDQSTIMTEVSKLLEDESAYIAMAQASNPYGDGKAAERILSAILDYTSD